MPKIRVAEISADYTVNALTEINNRLEELGITKENLISVQVLPSGASKESKLPAWTVAAFYWSD